MAGTSEICMAPSAHLISYPPGPGIVILRLLGPISSTPFNADVDRRPQIMGKHSPVDVATAILDELLAQAEAACGVRAAPADIGVPAHFTDAQREATKLAASRAGLDKVRLLEEQGLSAEVLTAAFNAVLRARPRDPLVVLARKLKAFAKDLPQRRQAAADDGSGRNRALPRLDEEEEGVVADLWFFVVRVRTNLFRISNCSKRNTVLEKT